MNNMKTIKHFLLLLPMITATVCAQAQTRKVVPAGQDYTIGNIVSASGDNVTYQWFRNGEPIPNATGENYTVPAILAKMDIGLSVTRTHVSIFQRAAYNADCMGGIAMSNEVTVYFCDLMVNGVCWAKANSDNSSRISSNPWDFGAMYQWNRPDVGYMLEDYGDQVTVSGWNNTPDNSPTWTNGFPCPSGWRLPTKQDFLNLHMASQPVGGLWIEGGMRDIPVGTNGRLYGYNTALCTMSNMVGCVFLPAAGHRPSSYGDGRLCCQHGYGAYWSSEQASATVGTRLGTTEGVNNPTSSSPKSNGHSIRCVIDVQ